MNGQDLVTENVTLQLEHGAMPMLCSCCKGLIRVQSDIALFLRHHRNGPFDALCVDCAHAIIQAALKAYLQ